MKQKIPYEHFKLTKSGIGERQDLKLTTCDNVAREHLKLSTCDNVASEHLKLTTCDDDASEHFKLTTLNNAEDKDSQMEEDENFQSVLDGSQISLNENIHTLLIIKEQQEKNLRTIEKQIQKMNKHMKEMNAQLNNLMKKQKDAQSLVEIVNEKIFHLKSDRSYSKCLNKNSGKLKRTTGKVRHNKC